MRTWKISLIVAALGTCFLFQGPAEATQVVFLDFDSSTDGNINYTGSMRDDIRDSIASSFSLFDFSLTLTQPTSGDYSTLFFNSGSTGGVAEAIDFRNLDHTDNAEINIDGWFSGSPSQQDLVNGSANIGSHELGHLSGLRHGDSFGPIGSGIHNPPWASDYFPTMPAPGTADETFDHLMGTPASIGSTIDNMSRSDLTFSERSAVKLAFAESGVVVTEQAGSHGTIPLAQSLTLAPLAVPNPLLAGDNAGKLFEVEAIDVVGELASVAEQDYYSFTGSGGDLWNFELMSNALDRITDTVDTYIEIRDSSGTLVPYYGSTASNDDEFETFDSIIIDLVLPEDDTYIIVVDNSPLVPRPNRTGDYELFGYKFAAIPEPATLGLLLMGGLALLRHKRST